MDKEDINQEYQLANLICNMEVTYNRAKYAVQDAKRKENSYNLIKYCKVCNIFVGFGARRCWKCRNENLEIMRRHIGLGQQSYRIESKILEKLERERFVGAFDGIAKVITHRILIERLIFCDDCVKMLSEEFNLTVQTIRRYLREIAAKLRAFE